MLDFRATISRNVDEESPVAISLNPEDAISVDIDWLFGTDRIHLPLN